MTSQIPPVFGVPFIRHTNGATQCPRCFTNITPEWGFCHRCGYGTIPHPVPAPAPAPPKPGIRKSYASIGEVIARDGWGPSTPLTIAETISKGDLPLNSISLLAVLVKEMQAAREELQAVRREMTNAAGRISRVIEKAPLKAEIALEKERQKTADKQRKANEAMPPTVKVIQCPNEAFRHLRIKRVF